jgi:7-cyano-7-deazaguanine synthase
MKVSRQRMNRMPKHFSAVVLVSGGVDSTASIRFYQKMGYAVRGMFVDFGQKAGAEEKRALKRISKAMNVPIDTVEVAGMSVGSGKIVGRNALFVAAGLMKYPDLTGILALGIHAGTSYEDCSAAFLEQMQKVADLYTGGRVRVGAPFIAMNKRNVFAYVKRLKIPIGLTYSCETGSNPPCGKCQSCIDRRDL